MDSMFENATNFDQNIKNWKVTDAQGNFISHTDFNKNCPLRKAYNPFVTIVYQPKTFAELKALCDDLTINLGDIDISLITEFSGNYNGKYVGLFQNSTRTDYSGIENWDVSNVTNMSYMFSYNQKFNQDISNWNTSNVTNMSWMFYNSLSFNQDISNWNTSNVTDMGGVFNYATNFNQDISMWNVNKVTNWIFFNYNCPGLLANNKAYTPPKFR